MAMKNDETRIAAEIVSVLPAGIARACSGDRETIRFAVSAEGLKLRSIVLRRESLRRLLDDPARAIKIEYLQRDLIRSAGRRAEFCYPRVTRPVAATSRRRAFPLKLPIASMV